MTMSCVPNKFKKSVFICFYIFLLFCIVLTAWNSVYYNDDNFEEWRDDYFPINCDVYD